MTVPAGLNIGHLNFYYNGLPETKTVTCLIDQVEAIVERDGAARTVLLEDFEDVDSPLWSTPVTTLRAETARAHGIEPAACGVLVCRESELAAAMEFKDAGFRVGLHFLGPSVYPPDPYLTPVPDRRLVHAATATLAAGVDEKAIILLTAESPQGFPAEDGGYEGSGTVLQIGDELIWYGQRALDSPFGFRECRRGHLGTKPAAHAKGDRVTHLVRSYGYHMFDMDTKLLDEVAAHFARVANACGIDMIYFDGSERLQGDHWY